ncbi:MAG: HutD family protein [Candidatus Saccharibacteria bacterium]|nr:HutD family protein [Rhodoferax sp.]
MSWNVVSLADVTATPWRNGGGVTRELVAWPPGDDWQWRMSVAEVERSGPFSRFEGVQRWFAVLNGAGLVLNIGGERHTLTAESPPLVFDGAAPTNCTLLAGANQDFNLMVRGLGARAAVRSAQVKEEPARRVGDTEQNVLPTSLRDGSSAASTCMARVTSPTRIDVNAHRVIAIWAINTWATLRLDQELINIPPQTLAWRSLPHVAELTLETDDALWMEIPQ